MGIIPPEIAYAFDGQTFMIDRLCPLTVKRLNAQRWSEAVRAVTDAMKHRERWEDDVKFRMAHAAKGGIYDIYAPGSVQDENGLPQPWEPKDVHDNPPSTPIVDHWRVPQKDSSGIV